MENTETSENTVSMKVGDPRPENVAIVEEVRQSLNTAGATLLTEYRGLKVKDLQALRRSLRDAGGEYKIYKNTLVRIAAASAGLNELEPMLKGPTGVTFVSGDAVEVAKVLREFARTNPNLIVKGGVLGNRVLNSAQAAALADMPPKNQVLAALAGLFEAPLAAMASLLEAPVRDIAYAIAALEDKLDDKAAA